MNLYNVSELPDMNEVVRMHLHFKLELKASRTPQAGERLLTSSRRSRDPEIEEEFSTQMANV